MQEFGGTTSGEGIKNYPYNIVFNDTNGRRSDRPNGGAYINATDISTSLTQAHSDTKIISQLLFDDAATTSVLQPIVDEQASPTLTSRMQGSAGWAPYNETAHLVPMGTCIAIPAVAYSLDSLSSNSMKSNNPNSGCNVVEVAKCIDTSIQCPSKNQGGIVLAFQSSELRLRGTLTPLDVAPTLKAETKCGDTELKVAMMFGTDCYNGAITGDVADTIGTPGSSVNASGPTVMHQQNYLTASPTITASNDPSRSPQSSEVTQQVAAVHASSMQVRRLTPTECERLQGFPDGWTAIPWKKKSADDCPDGPRYKALGNSMAVNCMEWIGERINAVHIKSQNHS